MPTHSVKCETTSEERVTVSGAPLNPSYREETLRSRRRSRPCHRGTVAAGFIARFAGFLRYFPVRCLGRECNTDEELGPSDILYDLFRLIHCLLRAELSVIRRDEYLLTQMSFPRGGGVGANSLTPTSRPRMSNVGLIRGCTSKRCFSYGSRALLLPARIGAGSGSVLSSTQIRCPSDARCVAVRAGLRKSASDPSWSARDSQAAMLNAPRAPDCRGRSARYQARRFLADFPLRLRCLRRIGRAGIFAGHFQSDRSRLGVRHGAYPRWRGARP